MPVVTRSRANKIAAPEPPRNESAPLTAQGTIVQKEILATGEGTHTRWIRPVEPNAEVQDILPMATKDQNQRFTTPIPEHPKEPVMPRTPRVGRFSGPGCPPYIARQPGSLSPSEADVVDFAKNVGTSKGKNLTSALQRHNGVENTAPHQIPPSEGQTPVRCLGTPFTEWPLTTDQHPPGNRLLLEVPRGRAHTIRSEAAMLLNPNERRRRAEVNSRGLGPEGTILVDKEGKPIVSGLYPGY